MRYRWESEHSNHATKQIGRGLPPGTSGPTTALSKNHVILENRRRQARSVTQEREILTTLLDDGAKLHEVAGTLPADDQRAQTLESVAHRRLALAPGMSVSIGASVLGLSEPTVRGWAVRGIFKVRSRKPRLLLDPASVLEVRQLVADLRDAGQTRGLLDEVYNRLADEQQLADPDLAESMDQMRRGEYVVRRPADRRWPSRSARRFLQAKSSRNCPAAPAPRTTSRRLGVRVPPS